MLKAIPPLLASALAVALSWSAPAAAKVAEKPPVVVELYTAQGCTACVAANAHAAELADRPGVLPLTFSVDYWDYLGWTDTFAKPAFAERQRAYVKQLDLREPYTPQVIVDGRHQAAGGKTAAVDKLVADARKAPKNPPQMLLRQDGKIAVGSGPAPRGGGEVWLIRYDPRAQEVAVRRGDNRGETIMHRNVVREVVRLGPWSGRPRLYKAPAAEEAGLRSVVLVQASRTGRILGVLQPKD